MDNRLADMSRDNLAMDGTYGGNIWVNMVHFSQEAMPNDRGHSSVMLPSSHSQPMDPFQQGHPPLSMLAMPSNPTWPSMCTNPSPSSYSPPPVPLPQAPAPLPVPLKTTKSPPLHTSSTPRKTMSDDYRRRMCEFAEDNPGMKQTEIGSHFGVERSTVSKVLRQKEKYLFPEDRSSSPVRRAKAKQPDIEKALTNWARNTEKRGHPITDAEIKEQAQYFAAHFAAGESPVRTSSRSWLERFKKKNGIGPGRLMRRASETTSSAPASRISPSLTPSQPSDSESPSSPPLPVSPSPMTVDRNVEKVDADQGMVDFNNKISSYKHKGSHTVMSSPFLDSAMSPTAKSTYFPDSSADEVLEKSRQLRPGGSHSGLLRPSGQTCPTSDMDCSSRQQETESLTPEHHVSMTTASSVNSATDDAAPFRAKSDSGISCMQTDTAMASSNVPSTPGGFSPSLPTQEDARCAVVTLLSFLRNVAPNKAVNLDEFETIVRLEERLTRACTI
ncbi:Major centromere autoantigen B [Pleurostoma richardsiae]|uniref:Major centromere autoantigen B n=1 Tax=Pleurostoma richardsiae TaxID=41990 RepID=A0AA38VD31_9PEZI|nr:Major centromere autoantigen B [Pleurostoma richardsiae]